LMNKSLYKDLSEKGYHRVNTHFKWNEIVKDQISCFEKII
jgi:hypothetical protein